MASLNPVSVAPHQAGEHEAAWADMLALGRAYAMRYLEDALAVARETMRRERRNVELIVQRTTPEPSRDKLRAHRERMRRQGLRPIQIWAPTCGRVLRGRGAPPILAVAASRHAQADQNFIDAISDLSATGDAG